MDGIVKNFRTKYVLEPMKKDWDVLRHYIGRFDFPVFLFRLRLLE